MRGFDGIPNQQAVAMVTAAGGGGRGVTGSTVRGW